MKDPAVIGEDGVCFVFRVLRPVDLLAGRVVIGDGDFGAFISYEAIFGGGALKDLADIGEYCVGFILNVLGPVDLLAGSVIVRDRDDLTQAS